MFRAILSSDPGKILVFRVGFVIAVAMAVVSDIFLFHASPLAALFYGAAISAGIFWLHGRSEDWLAGKAKNDLDALRKKRTVGGGKEPISPRNKRKDDWSQAFAHARTFWTIAGVFLIFALLFVLSLQIFEYGDSMLFFQFLVVLPHIMILPLFLFMWMFIWYGALTIPGFLRVPVLTPHDEGYSRLKFSDVIAQDHAVREVQKQIRLLQQWSKQKTDFNDFGFKALVGNLALLWFKIPRLLLKHFFLKAAVLLGIRKEMKLNRAAKRELKKLIKPQHMIFQGPPGTGKTYLGKAVANEAGNVPYILLPATVVHQPFLGVGVILWTLIQHLKINKTAKKWGGVIVIIDEIDTFAMARSGMTGGTNQRNDIIANILRAKSIENRCGLSIRSDGFLNYVAQSALPKWMLDILSIFMIPVPGGGGAYGTEAVLTQVLMWLDGMESPPMMYRLKRGIVNFFRDAFFFWMPPKVTIGGDVLYTRIPPGEVERINFLVIGLTNRFHMLDEAIKRKGRLGRHIPFYIPPHEGLKDLVRYYLQKSPHDPELDSEENINIIASLLSGSPPVTVQDVIENAFHIRVEREEAYEDQESVKLTWEDIQESYRNTKYGYAVENLHNEQSLKETSLHESGHLLAAHYFFDGIERANEFSIVARGNSLGRVDTISVDERDTRSRDRKAFLARLRVFLAGRVIEEIEKGEQRAGARSDIAIATLLANYMATELMYDPIPCSDENWNKYKEIGSKLFSLKPSRDMAPGAWLWGTKTVPTDERIAVHLGQAYADCWQFSKDNRDEIARFAAERYENGEFELSGADLQDKLKHCKIKKMSTDVVWPDPEYTNPFRDNSARGE